MKISRTGFFLVLLSLFDSSSAIAQTLQTGSFSGVIRFTGEMPALPSLVTQNDSNTKDAEVCALKSIPDESLVIDLKSRGISNVFVYLRKWPENLPKEGENESNPPLIVKLQGCRYSPHAIVMRTTDRVKLDIQDQVAHNPHLHPIKNSVVGPIFNPDSENNQLQKLPEPEPIPVKVTCDIHPWMKMYILPLDHPFAAVTDQFGKFEIVGLPPAEYEFWIWHEKAGWLEKKYKVKIDAGEKSEANLIYTKRDFVVDF